MESNGKFTARVPQVTVIDPRIPEKTKLRVCKGGYLHDLYHW